MTLRLLQTRLAIAATAALALACASAPRHEAAIQAGRSAHVLLVLPLNVAMSLPEGIADRSLDVWQELESYLRAHDKRLKTVSYYDARRLWRESVERARRAGESGEANYDGAARFFVRELRRHTGFDADGNKLQEGQGGLDLLVRARVDEGFSGFSDNRVWYFEARPDSVFESEKLREGIVQALQPFLPALSPDEK